MKKAIQFFIILTPISLLIWVMALCFGGVLTPIGVKSLGYYFGSIGNLFTDIPLMLQAGSTWEIGDFVGLALVLVGVLMAATLIVLPIARRRKNYLWSLILALVALVPEIGTFSNLGNYAKGFALKHVGIQVLSLFAIIFAAITFGCYVTLFIIMVVDMAKHPGVKVIKADEDIKDNTYPEEIQKEDDDPFMEDVPEYQDDMKVKIIDEPIKTESNVKSNIDLNAIRQIVKEEIELALAKYEKVELINVVKEARNEVKEELNSQIVDEIINGDNIEVSEEAKKVYERISFIDRMINAEEDMKKNYSLLKNEILSYGVKSRVSNSGDTFRLHKKTYVKITIAGKSLKLYFALDPKDYENTTIPVQDAGNKGIYEEIPLVFKVKSDLSIRRCKELIKTVMEKDGLTQGKIKDKDWIEELKIIATKE